MALNDKQRIFCIEYMKDLNGSKAAERAGYSMQSSPQIASELLNENPEVAARIQELMNQRAARAEVTADEVLSSILEIRDRCLQVAPVRDRKGQQVYVETQDGSVVPAFEFNAKDAIKANELLGKHLKLFGVDATGLSLNVTNMGRVEVEQTDASGEVTRTSLSFDVGAKPDHKTT